MKPATIAILAVLVILIGGTGLWYASTKTEAPVNTVPEMASSTGSASGTPKYDLPVAPAPGSVPGVPVGSVAGQTIWGDLKLPEWKIGVKYETSWKVSSVKDDKGEPVQVSMGSAKGSYFVSRNLKIAEPKLEYTITSRKIAGKTVSVHYFKNPNASYVAYEYFGLPVGGDVYYFQIKEISAASTKEVQDFLDFVTVK